MRKSILIGGTIFSLLSSFTMAEEVDSLLLFGNSFFDTGAGNEVADSLGTFLPNPTPPYFDGRHSNGPIWIDYASDWLELPVNNFAVAGSETGAGNFANPLLGGLFQQLQRFVGTLTSPTHPIKFDELVIVDGGGNDYFSLLNNPIDLNPAGVAATTVQAIQNLEIVFGTLQALGAKQVVMWNLGDMGKLPLFTDPASPVAAAQPLYSAATLVYNDALEQLVQGFNAISTDQKQIFIFDAFTVFNELEAELMAQGVDVTQHTITTIPTVPPTYITTGPQPEHLAFYDEVHPTTFAWQIFANSIAAYIDTLSNGPAFIAAEQDLAFESARAHRDLLDNHFRTLHMERYVTMVDECDCSCGMPLFQFYIDAEQKWGSTNSRRGVRGLTYNTELVSIGADLSFDNSLTVGASFTAQNNRSRVHGNHGRIDLNDYIPTVYAFYSDCNYFIDAALSYHFYDFRKVRRHIPFLDRTAKGRPDGRGWEGNLAFGLVKEYCNLTILPIVGVDYQNLQITKYHEKGAGFLNLKARRQQQNSLIGKIGAQAFWELCDSRILPFGEFFYEHEFMRHRHTYRTTFVNSTDNAIIFSQTGRPKLDYLKFAFGVDAQINDFLTGNISYEGETTFTEYNNTIRLEINSVF